VVAGVDLQEHAELGHALTAASVLGRAALLDAGDPGRGEDTPDGGAGNHNPFALGQEFCEMLVVQTLVDGLSQVEDPVPDLRS